MSTCTWHQIQATSTLYLSKLTSFLQGHQQCHSKVMVIDAIDEWSGIIDQDDLGWYIQYSSQQHHLKPAGGTDGEYVPSIWSCGTFVENFPLHNVAEMDVLSNLQNFLRTSLSKSARKRKCFHNLDWASGKVPCSIDREGGGGVWMIYSGMYRQY